MNKLKHKHYMYDKGSYVSWYNLNDFFKEVVMILYLVDITNLGNTDREWFAGGSWRFREAVRHQACFIHCRLQTLPDNVVQVFHMHYI